VHALKIEIKFMDGHSEEGIKFIDGHSEEEIKFIS
jgi:hypothetical protein